MPRFRKKPVEIEAFRLDGSQHDETEFVAFMGDDPFEFDEYGVTIQTLEGAMLARPGDWIIRGVKGELYPCKADIFDATYEPVTS